MPGHPVFPPRTWAVLDEVVEALTVSSAQGLDAASAQKVARLREYDKHWPLQETSFLEQRGFPGPNTGDVGRPR